MQSQATLTIVTACNDRMGSGHFWRMTALLDLALSRGIDARLVSDNLPSTMPLHLKGYSQLTLPDRGAIVVRDMRDSTQHEIILLKKSFNTVFVVDDAGDGSLAADHAIQLLPLPQKPTIDHNMFLFGYNFLSFLSQDQSYTKKFPLAVYSASLPSEYREQLIAECDPQPVVFCDHQGTTLCHRGITKKLHLSGHEAMAMSSNFISHFGISLFEASLLSCNLIAINPTEYHSTLCDIEDRITIDNRGLLSPDNIRSIQGKLEHNSGKVVTLQKERTLVEKKHVALLNYILDHS